MDQRIRRLLTMGAVALVCLVLVTAPVPAAQRDPLQAASIALSAHLVTTLHLEGFGATYSATPTQREMPARVPLQSYQADIDFTQDTGREPIWMTPQGFLRAARAAKATIREVPQGTEVSFTTKGQTFVGLINASNEVDRVETWVDDQGLGDLMLETLFRDYEKTASGVWFPTHIMQNHGRYPSLDVWVSAVTVNHK
jgi:hypothetical protein